ncbi:MAG: hypothetical protein QXP68_06045 [Thermosphaera sp.]|jgi:hypothetical protein|uniref:hypothetical protein n=1 Tax=Thermofilum sp. TaxID=1961369 RepID=UPI00316A8DE4
MEYEARYRRFVSIRDVSVLNERVFGAFRVKHLLYLFPAIILLWGGLQGRAMLLVLGCIVGLMGVLSALFSRGSMSLEAKLLAVFIALFDLLFQPREEKRK